MTNGESLYDIAKEKRFSPYKLAKIYTKYKYPNDFKLSRVLSDLSATELDSRIAADIIRCCLEDPSSSQIASAVKHCMGKEYEELLYDALKGHSICFETEAELRLQGKPKTPDALLLFPMGVKIGAEDDWHIIHWIDSKGKSRWMSAVANACFPVVIAMFGDVVTFDEHLEQLHGYVNRYGKGLVIYWHGIVNQLIDRSPSVIAIDM